MFIRDVTIGVCKCFATVNNSVGIENEMRNKVMGDEIFNVFP